MNAARWSWAGGLVAFMAWLVPCGNTLAGEPAPVTSRLAILVTLDGVRWQEVFGGAQDDLLNKRYGGVANINALRQRYCMVAEGEKRAALMPFVWSHFNTGGQLFGNQKRGGIARVTNGLKFSYPGYNEILCGYPDASLTNNNKLPNPNASVLEWVQAQTGFQGKVAALANWDVFPYILNRERSLLPVWSGLDTPLDASVGSRQELISRLARDTVSTWPDMIFDSFFCHAAVDYLSAAHPRLLYVAFTEPDEWAHEGRYDLYLNSVNRIDGYLRRLWEAAQAQPEFRDRTTMLVTTDHGRGSGPLDWKSHGHDVDGAEDIWIAVMGPGVACLGERTNAPAVFQNQVAATLAASLGLDYNAAQPKAGKPLPMQANTPVLPRIRDSK